MVENELKIKELDLLYNELDELEDEVRYIRSQIEKLEDELSPKMCASCNGSGEGHYDGTTCWNCKGSGTE